MIIIDVDGVLADFESSFQKWFGKTSHRDYTEKFWREPPYHFWKGLKKISEPQWMFDAVKNDRVLFLSNCPSPMARMDWLKENGFWKEGYLFWCQPVPCSKVGPVHLLDPLLVIDDWDKHITELKTSGFEKVFWFDTKNSKKCWKEIEDHLDEQRASRKRSRTKNKQSSTRM